MEYIDKLRESIKNNTNLSEEFKCNLANLTDTIVTIFPEYDYFKLDNMLKNLNFVLDNEIDTYSLYDKNSNIIKLNTDKIFEDRIDMQHLILDEILLRSSGIENDALEGFNIGITEAVSSTMNSDESMAKLNPLQYSLISLFSKIVDGKTIIDAYMNGDIANLAFELESFGVGNEEFVNLVTTFNKVNTEDDSFVNAELMMIDMYNKKVNHELKNGLITYDDIGNKYEDFRNMLVFKRSDLICLYPHHDFSYLTCFESVQDHLDTAILNTENLKEENIVK